MSEQNVETARRLAEATDRRDWALAAEHCWPDAEAKAPEGWPEAGDAKGMLEIQRQFERMQDTLDEPRFEESSIEALDEARVLQHGHWRGTGKGSGIEVDLEVWILYAFKDGKASRMEFFIDRDKAMRAAGR